MSEVSKFDELLTTLGTGRWNMIHFLGAAYWFMMVSPQAVNVVYHVPPLNYTCRPDPHHNASFVSEDSCSYFRWTSDGLVEESCTEWDFDNSTYTSTLTSEFGLVCERAYLRATYQSVYMIACIVGALITGYSADRFGRKKAILVILCLYTTICNAMAGLTSFTAILVFRFLLGGLTTHSFYILGMEVCEIKHRTTAGVIMSLPWAFGVMFLGAAAYFIRQWRYLQLAISLPYLVLFPIVYLVNESPRWLIVTGHYNKALRVLKRAARLNRTTMPLDNTLKAMMTQVLLDHQQGTRHRKTSSCQEAEKGVSERDENSKNDVVVVKPSKKAWWLPPLPKLFSTPKIRQVITALCLQLFVASMNYYGISLSGATYTNNPFLYMVVGGLVEIPPYIILLFTLDRFGRRYPGMVCYTYCALILLVIYFMPNHIEWLVLTVYMLCKVGVTTAFLIPFVSQAELIPTEVRVQGPALTYMAGQVAAAVVPYLVNDLGPLIPWLPTVIFACASFLAAASYILLPETKGKNLPDTIADLDHI